MKIFICDDEPRILKSISEKVKEILADCTVNEFSDSLSLLEALKNEECELLLLDIDMPQLGGLEIAGQLKLLRQKPLLVFVTSHDELVYDSLLFHPFGFCIGSAPLARRNGTDLYQKGKRDCSCRFSDLPCLRANDRTDSSGTAAFHRAIPA